MFDELKEYKEYTDMSLFMDVNDKVEEMICTVDANDEQRKILEEVKKGLQKWCGFDEAASDTSEDNKDKKSASQNDSDDAPGGDSLIGLARVLTIIARYQLYHVYDYGKFSDPDYISSGSTTVVPVKYSGWLRYFYNQYVDYNVSVDEKGKSVPVEEKLIRPNPFIFCPSKKRAWTTAFNLHSISRSEAGLIDTFDYIALKKKRLFNYPLFMSSSNNVSNTYRVINYDLILAEAIMRGPLHSYALICRESYLNSLCSDKGKKRNKGCANEIARYIGLYLIEKRICSEKYVGFNTSDLSHWMNKDKSGHEYYANTTCFLDSDNKYTNVIDFLLDGKKISKGNTKTFCVNEEFLKLHDFSLILMDEENVYDKLAQLNTGSDKYICFADGGVGKDLKLIK